MESDYIGVTTNVWLGVQLEFVKTMTGIQNKTLSMVKIRNKCELIYNQCWNIRIQYSEREKERAHHRNQEYRNNKTLK